MNFALFQEESFSVGEVMRALEEIEGLWQDGENQGMDDDEMSETFGSVIYVIPAKGRTLEDIQTQFTDILGYDTIEGEEGDMVFYRMDTVVIVKHMGDVIQFCIDHSGEGEFEGDEDTYDE